MRFSPSCFLLALATIAGCGVQAPTSSPASVASTEAVESPAAKTAANWLSALVSVDGVEHQPLADPQTKAVAFVFILPDCPIANSYAPEWSRLHESFRPRGVHLLLVHADPAITAEEARRHAQEFQLQPPVLLDPRHELVKLAGATKTPEAAVFSPSGELLYRGRIDDRYVGLGKRRTQATRHDLREALEAILAGRPAPPGGEAVGCFIPEGGE